MHTGALVFGNPATLSPVVFNATAMGPVALRPRLTTGLPLSVCRKIRHLSCNDLFESLSLQPFKQNPVIRVTIRLSKIQMFRLSINKLDILPAHKGIQNC